ncbi:unnamed protein product [Didymodactylos carnosus]|uniref:Uncharacterized protein n=1 Tax=Didymodactylos carnosus TaxID=1234261 RepID=A0A815WCB3_9BILA|nr:unnamed protein product [Didymodactylos carnosus]CAF4407631.1 unnamed protein product [Didymodactylos carnosus]
MGCSKHSRKIFYFVEKHLEDSKIAISREIMNDDDSFDAFAEGFTQFKLPSSMTNSDMKTASLKSDFIQSSSATITTTTNSSVHQPIEEKIISNIILNVRLKFDYNQLTKFVEELKQRNSKIVVNQKSYSIFELYTLYTTSEPIDLTNQKIRKTYRPSLFIRKADAFGAWNFNFLLGLFDVEYECPDENNNEFPPVWKTTFDTNVEINIIHLSKQTTTKESKSDEKSNESENKSNEPATTLLDILKAICQENKYDENDAFKWLQNLKAHTSFDSQMDVE